MPSPSDQNNLGYLVEASLSDTPAEARARCYALDRQRELRTQLKNGPAAMLMLAVPLGEVEADVFCDDLEQMMTQNDTFLSARGLAPSVAPFGLVAVDDRRNPTWRLEVHESGLMALIRGLFTAIDVGGSGPAPTIFQAADFITVSAFCSLLGFLRDKTDPRPAYLLRLGFLGLEKPILQPSGFRRGGEETLVSGDNWLPELRVKAEADLPAAGITLRNRLARGLGVKTDPFAEAS